MPSTNDTMIPMPTNECRNGAQGEPPFSYLWKGICDLFTGIFKPKEEEPWKDIVKELEEEVKGLEVRLAEKTKSEEKMKAWMDGQVERGTKSMQNVLTEHANETHAKRMEEIRGLGLLLQRHEDLVTKHQRCMQAFEDLVRKHEEVVEQNRFLMGLNEELARLKIELENRLRVEMGKAAMYERSWYGRGGRA